MGLKRHCERGPAYDAVVAEFFEAAQDKFGDTVLIQFEFRLLDTWQDRACCFNDFDIQGAASEALAGLFATAKVTGKGLSDDTYLFAGAGEAGTYWDRRADCFCDRKREWCIAGRRATYFWWIPKVL